MGKPSRLVAVYLVRGQSPMPGWAGDEMFLFSPQRVEVNIVEGQSVVLRISGAKAGSPREYASAVFDSDGGAPLSDAPQWALDLLNEARKLLHRTEERP